MSRGPAPGFEAGTDVSPGLEDFGHRLMIGEFSVVVVRAGFRHREYPPPPGLGESVACRWHSEVLSPVAHRLRIVPDGCTEILFSQERGFPVYGPGTEWSDVLVCSWSRIANDLGFSDKSHLFRELRSLTGMRPTETVS